MNNLHEYCVSMQSAQLVLISLFNLNPPEFSLMLAALPKAFQVRLIKHTYSKKIAS